MAVRDEGLARRPLVHYVPSFKRAPAVGTTDVLGLGCGLLPAVGVQLIKDVYKRQTLYCSKALNNCRNNINKSLR